MAAEPHYIDVDLKKKTQFELPKVTQSDTDTVFILRVTDDGRSGSDILDAFSTVTLTSERRDRESFYTAGTKIPGKNEVRFNLGTKELELVGKVTASAQFYSVDGRKSSAHFYYEVEKDLTGEYVPTETEAGLIETVLIDGPGIIGAAQKATEDTLQSLEEFNVDKAESLEILDTTIEENKTNWKQEVATVALRNSTYPNPQSGDTVRITGEARIDRFNGTEWITTDRYNPAVIDQVIGQLADTAKKSEVQSLVVNKAEVTYVDTKLNDIGVPQINKSKGKLDQTYMTDEFIAQFVENTQPVNAVPARESLDRGKFTKNAVTPDLLSFAEKPNNLFNNTDVIKGFTITAATGALAANASFVVTDFIYVKPNQSYITKEVGRYALYDQAGSFIVSTASTTFTTPSNAYFARFVVALGGLAVAQINEGTTLLPFDAHEYTIKSSVKTPINIVPSLKSIITDAYKKESMTPEKTTFLVASNNLFNKNDVQIGKTMDFVGDILDDPDFVLSGFIEINPNAVYAKTSSLFLRMMLHDRNKNFIRRESFNQADPSYIVPRGVHYVRISCTATAVGDVMFNEGSTSLPYEEYKFILKSTIKYPIEIDSSLLPVGTGEGSGEASMGLGEQFIYNDSSLYTTGQSKTICDVGLKGVVDIIEFSSNNILSELQIYYKRKDGTEFLYDLVSKDGTTSIPNTFTNMQLHGSSIVDFIEFDDVNKVFKIYTKDLNFAHGFKIVVKNNALVNANISTRVVSRQYA